MEIASKSTNLAVLFADTIDFFTASKVSFFLAQGFLALTKEFPAFMMSGVGSCGSLFPSEKGESKTDSHYTDISSKYDYLFQPSNQANTPIIINKLQLTPDDLLLDIGAATGQQAHLIWKQVGLKNPVTCVEPCQAFFEHASKLDGVVLVKETAEQAFDHLFQNQVANQRPFNKVLLVGVIHHFDDIAKCLGQILDYLPKNGVCFILSTPFSEKSLTSLPLTAVHLQHLKEKSNPFDIILPYVKSRDDVITEVTNEEPTFRIPKSRWYDMIRSRFWSHFRRYTDQALEESIKELDNGRFKGVKDDELITVVEECTGVTLTKK